MKVTSERDQLRERVAALEEGLLTADTALKDATLLINHKGGNPKFQQKAIDAINPLLKGPQA